MNAVEIKNLGKKYTILHEGRGSADYATFRDVISGGAGHLRRKFRGERNDTPRREEIWALKDINLEIPQGGKVGIIGRNGAGKTTLLKILSRITEPTSGSAEISGRVSSLLEVGTGFHPELTGRENIYLNGAVLGMKKKEIDAKYDEIVDFSGVEKFLDTPVKRFSSGMKVRLAFAVAAHLEPEILLVDEVLAVGDAEFQKKCLGKMDDVSRRQGRTILFVSHNMAAIQSLCERVVFLEDGQVAADGDVDEVVRQYIGGVSKKIEETPLEEREDRTGGDVFRFTRVEFLDAKTETPVNAVMSGQDVLIRLHYRLKGVERLDGVEVGLHFFANDRRYLFCCSSSALCKKHTLSGPDGFILFRVYKWPLVAGEYVYLLSGTQNRLKLDRIEEAGKCFVEDGDFFGTGKIAGRTRGGMLVQYEVT